MDTAPPVQTIREVKLNPKSCGTCMAHPLLWHVTSVPGVTIDGQYRVRVIYSAPVG